MAADLPALPYPPALARRTVLAGALGLAGAALVGVPGAQAAAPSVGSRVRDTYLAAGGASVFGTAVSAQAKQRISHHSTYGQEFTRGTVWYGSGVGKVDLPASRVRLDSAPNFRPVLGAAGLWRSDDLDGCTALEKRIVVDLGIATMIAMNSGGDPSIPGVDVETYKISNSGSNLEFYAGYVTREDSRRSVGQVLTHVARSDLPVLVHCHGGKDRTGWVCDLMQRVAGIRRSVRDQDYLATRWYSGADVELAWLAAARDQLAADYGTVSGYLVTGCGMQPADVALLKKRLA